MKEAFNKIEKTIYSIDSLEHITACERLIRTFAKRYGHLGHNYRYTLLGMLEAVKMLKFEK